MVKRNGPSGGSWRAVSQFDKEEWLRLAGEWIKLAQSAEGHRPKF
jgi:hypothetical protein